MIFMQSERSEKSDNVSLEKVKYELRCEKWVDITSKMGECGLGWVEISYEWEIQEVLMAGMWW